MASLAFDKTERDAILQAYHDAMGQYNAAMDNGDYDAADPFLADARRHETEYFKRLPRFAVATCPFTNKPLSRTFDPFGLDGLWWGESATPKELPAGPHFCVLRGAVNFNGRPPRGGPFDAHVGPEVPYVIPRLLSMDGMVAVLGELPMEPGYTAYTIAYFSERRPPVEELTADWPRTVFNYTTSLGEVGWKAPVDLWDFELLPWLNAGKLRWCEPGSNNMRLAALSPAQCPYLNLPGAQERIVVRDNTSWSAGLPDGEPVWPIDTE